MIKHIQKKIENLRNEIIAIDYTSNADNLKITDFDEKTILTLRAKIAVLNEILISYKK